MVLLELKGRKAEGVVTNADWRVNCDLVEVISVYTLGKKDEGTKTVIAGLRDGKSDMTAVLWISY